MKPLMTSCNYAAFDYVITQIFLLRYVLTYSHSTPIIIIIIKNVKIRVTLS